jgi:NADP-dependent 3-hydroxy acid dehydrogenase YdfG
MTDEEGDAMLHEKVVWITGAGSGIGRATARLLARQGAQLVLMGRRKAVLEGAYDEVVTLGGRGRVAPLDVADRAEVNRIAAELLGALGRVDILVNNAGLNVPRRRLRDLSGEDWDAVIGVNLTGAYNLVQAVLPPMRRQNGGLVVNVSSMAGKRVSPLGGAAYTASKHGMNALSASINAEEWAHGIRATAICPGEVNTEFMQQRPMPVDPAEQARMIQPEDVAEMILFLATLPPRTTVTELLVMPTHQRQHKPGETT